MGLTARKAEKFSILRQVSLVAATKSLAGAAITIPLVAPCDGELVDVVVSQGLAGTGGTSWAAGVTKRNGTNMLATNPSITLAAGANVKGDVRRKIPNTTGVTRAVLHATRSNRRVARGDSILVTITPTGTYTGTAPDVGVVLEIAADQ